MSYVRYESTQPSKLVADLVPTSTPQSASNLLQNSLPNQAPLSKTTRATVLPPRLAPYQVKHSQRKDHAFSPSSATSPDIGKLASAVSNTVPSLPDPDFLNSIPSSGPDGTSQRTPTQPSAPDRSQLRLTKTLSLPSSAFNILNLNEESKVNFDSMTEEEKVSLIRSIIRQPRFLSVLQTVEKLCHERIIHDQG
jgi:hypothetical protein